MATEITDDELLALQAQLVQKLGKDLPKTDVEKRQLVSRFRETGALGDNRPASQAITSDVIKKIQNDIAFRMKSGFLDPKKEIALTKQMVADKFPGSNVQVIPVRGQTVVVVDGKPFLTDPGKGDVVGEIAEQTGRFAVPAAELAAGVLAGPLAVGAVAGAAQAGREAIESGLPGEQQNLLQRVGDVALMGGVSYGLAGLGADTGKIGRGLERANTQFLGAEGLRTRAARVAAEKQQRQVLSDLQGVKGSATAAKLQTEMKRAINALEGPAKARYRAAETVSAQNLRSGQAATVDLTQAIQDFSERVATSGTSLKSDDVVPYITNVFNQNRKDVLKEQAKAQFDAARAAGAKGATLDDFIPKWEPSNATGFDLAKINSTIRNQIAAAKEPGVRKLWEELDSLFTSARQELARKGDFGAKQMVDADKLYAQSKDLVPNSIREKFLFKFNPVNKRLEEIPSLTAAKRLFSVPGASGGEGVLFDVADMQKMKQFVSPELGDEIVKGAVAAKAAASKPGERLLGASAEDFDLAEQILSPGRLTSNVEATQKMGKGRLKDLLAKPTSIEESIVHQTGAPSINFDQVAGYFGRQGENVGNTAPLLRELVGDQAVEKGLAGINKGRYYDMLAQAPDIGGDQIASSISNTVKTAIPGAKTDAGTLRFLGRSVGRGLQEVGKPLEATGGALLAPDVFREVTGPIASEMVGTAGSIPLAALDLISGKLPEGSSLFNKQKPLTEEELMRLVRR